MENFSLQFSRESVWNLTSFRLWYENLISVHHVNFAEQTMFWRVDKSYGRGNDICKILKEILPGKRSSFTILQHENGAKAHHIIIYIFIYIFIMYQWMSRRFEVSPDFLSVKVCQWRVLSLMASRNFRTLRRYTHYFYFPSC